MNYAKRFAVRAGRSVRDTRGVVRARSGQEFYEREDGVYVDADGNEFRLQPRQDASFSQIASDAPSDAPTEEPKPEEPPTEG